MNLDLLIPFFSENTELEKGRYDTFNNWLNESGLRDRSEPDVHPGITGPRHPVGGSDAWRRRKGAWVREELIAITNSVAPEARARTAVILVDGSGKIKFNSIFAVIIGLHKHDVVLGCRGEDWGISETRVPVERFENYLIEERFQVSLPDAQAGCWGFRASGLKHISLTATAYEIELDLLIASLERRLSLAFADIQIDTDLIRRAGHQSQYRPGPDDLKKVVFLCERLGYSGDVVRALARQFEDETRVPLSEDYWGIIRNLSVSFPKARLPRLPATEV